MRVVAISGRNKEKCMNDQKRRVGMLSQYQYQYPQHTSVSSPTWGPVLVSHLPRGHLLTPTSDYGAAACGKFFNYSAQTPVLLQGRRAVGTSVHYGRYTLSGLSQSVSASQIASLGKQTYPAYRY